MEIGQELDDYIKSSIDHTMGFIVPDQNLQLKFKSLEITNYRLRDQYLLLQSKLKEKETALQRARAEASMNAQAVKKFVEENQKLARECKFLVDQCNKLEQECSLYDHDREALREFGNEADERAKEAEIRAKEAKIRVNEVEEELKSVTDQLKYYKHQYENLSVGSSADEGTVSEQILLNALVASQVIKSDVPESASAFLEANSGIEMCRELLEMWVSLRPETQNVLSLANSVRTLKVAKEHLRTNLNRAEEEVNVLAEENSALVEEIKRLLKGCQSEKKRANSGEKHDSSARAKSNKRKTSPGMASPVDRKIDFSDMESLRYALSPLQENSPCSKLLKI